MTKVMLPETFEYIVDTMHDRLMDSPEEVRNKFLLTVWKGNSLIQLHNSLGRDIRNEFNLWQYTWEPELDETGTFDQSPNHPDAISMRIIEEVWKRGQKDETKN